MANRLQEVALYIGAAGLLFQAAALENTLSEGSGISLLLLSQPTPHLIRLRLAKIL